MNLGPTACMVIVNMHYEPIRKSADRSQVKVMYWVDNDEQNSLTGITARFGQVLPSSVYDGKKESFAVLKPESGCAKTAGTLAGAVALVQRGECTFIEKAKAAEASGASALVIINDEDGRSVVLDLRLLLLSLATTSLVANTGGMEGLQLISDPLVPRRSAEDDLHRQGPASEHQHPGGHGVQVRRRQASGSR
jgi:hypothetical protein